MNLQELEAEKEENREERRAFVKLWAEYVRTHDDEEWSRQQNVIIDAQVPVEADSDAV